MSVKQKKKLGTGVGYALQIIEEGKRPMSPDQIKGKYQLEFPFTIKRVLPAPFDKWECGCTKGLLVGELLTCTGLIEDAGGVLCIFVGECNCGDGVPLNPSAEKYVLADKA